MPKLLSKLPAFALPFVTRSLRGGRDQRFMFLSLALASMVVLLGVWIGLGYSELRGDLDLEASLHTALAVAGLVAGLILMGLATVVLPLLVAIALAQERHENTLMPLTGTALNPRELALGIASGPTAVVAMFAAPQLLLFMLYALVAGELLMASALLVALAATAAVFVFGAQLLAQLIGQRRTPGAIGIVLMGAAGFAWLFAAGFALSGSDETTGFAAVVPQIGLTILFTEVFTDLPIEHGRLLLSTAAWIVGALILAWLTLTALARDIGGQEGPLLSFGQALLGALTCIALVNVAMPIGSHDAAGLRQFVGLGMLAPPLALLLMARVPRGDAPACMRTVPVRSLLLEFGGWAVAHVALGLAFGFEPEVFHPVALLWLGWCVLVLGLIGIRAAAVPSKAAANLWLAFCLFSLTVGFGQATMWGLEEAHGLEDVFVMAQIDPLFGVLQIALTIWIPLSLARQLRKSLAAVD